MPCCRATRLTTATQHCLSCSHLYTIENRASGCHFPARVSQHGISHARQSYFDVQYVWSSTHGTWGRMGTVWGRDTQYQRFVPYHQDLKVNILVDFHRLRNDRNVETSNKVINIPTYRGQLGLSITGDYFVLVFVIQSALCCRLLFKRRLFLLCLLLMRFRSTHPAWRIVNQTRRGFKMTQLTGWCCQRSFECANILIKRRLRQFLSLSRIEQLLNAMVWPLLPTCSPMALLCTSSYLTW